MVRAFVLYAEEPEPERYLEHVELCRRVEGATFRHGPIFGSASGDSPKVNLGSLYLKATSLHGLWLSKLVSYPDLINAAMSSMSPWIESGVVNPQVGAVLQLEQAADAYRLLIERRNFGKVVLRVH